MRDSHHTTPYARLSSSNLANLVNLANLTFAPKKSYPQSLHNNTPAGCILLRTCYNTRMNTYTNIYHIGNHIDLLVGEHEPGVRQFSIFNTLLAVEEEISENTAKALCITPDSIITEENWEDFCTASGIFVEDN